MIYDNDIDLFINSDFAQELSYSGVVGGVRTLSGIVDEPGSIKMIGDVLVQVTKRQVTFKSKDVPSPSNDDFVTYNGTTYNVTAHNADGTGFVVVTLTKDGR